MQSIKAASRLIVILGAFCSLAANGLAQSYQAPLFLDSSSGCSPSTEVCGDGVDQDCNGKDLLCDGPDRDRDGYTTNDCDDTNRRIYPGEYISCAAECGQGIKQCQDNGSFSSCSCTPLCEAVGSGSCYYISKLTGSDSNPGTFTQPWKTVSNITSYFGDEGKPSSWVQLKAGDVVYFQSGVYNKRYEYRWMGEQHLLFYGVHGTASAPITLRAYPGAHPVLAPPASTQNEMTPFVFYQSSHFVVDGFEVTASYGGGISLDETNHVELKNLYIHGVDGRGEVNIAGLHLLEVEDVTLHHSVLHDNYDRRGTNPNSRNIVIFGGGDIAINHNVIFQSKPIEAAATGGCIGYKHGRTVAEGTFEVGHNILYNCANESIATGTSLSHIHHNLLLNSKPIGFSNLGGDTYMYDSVVEFNTLIGSKFLHINPSSIVGDFGSHVFRGNVIVDDNSYNVFKGLVTICDYCDSSKYADVAPDLSFSENCYFNSNSSLVFNLFAQAGSDGGSYTFSNWQSEGYDTNSFNIDPALNASFVPQTAQCSSFGWTGS